MKKISILGFLSIVLNLLFLADAFYFHYVLNPFAAHEAAHVHDHEKHDHEHTALRVAILTPISHPSLEQIQQGFTDSLNKECGTDSHDHHAHYEFTVYNANGNRALMRSQAEEIVNNKYDLIFTIGTGTSMMAKEITTKKGIEIPIVYAAVSDPVGSGLIESMESSHNHVTGVTEPRNIPLQTALLRMLKPSTKKVLIAYDPGQDRRLESDKDAFAAQLEKDGIAVQSIEIFQTNEVTQKVSPFLNDIDVLIILKDNTLVSCMDTLARLCNRNGVTIYASDLDSSDKGAALAFGVTEYSFGVHAAQKARAILEEHRDPAIISSTPVDEFKIKINTSVAKEQGLTIDPTLFFIAQNTLIK